MGAAGAGGGGACVGAGGDQGDGSLYPAPLFPLGRVVLAQGGLLVGVSLLGAGGFGHLLLLAHTSQSVMGVVSCCLLVCWP